MEEPKAHIRYSKFWEFKNNKNVTETAEKISDVYDQDIVIDREVRNCFSKFPFSDNWFRDEHRPERISEHDQDALRELVKYNSSKSTWELALEINTSDFIVCCHYKTIKKIRKLDVWLPRTLN